MTSSETKISPIGETGLSECFHKVSTTMYVALAPVYTLNPLSGIKSQHLDPLLMTYFAPVEGVILTHSNVRLLGNDEDLDASKDGNAVYAKVKYDSPFAYLWIAVDFIVWKPLPGDKLEGIVTLQSPSHIGLLIHDTFNGRIRRDGIPSDWYFEHFQADEEVYEEDAVMTSAMDKAAAELEKDEQSIARAMSKAAPKSLGNWYDSEGTKIEGKIQFTVKAFQVSSRYVSVQGTLLDPNEIPVDLTLNNKKYTLENNNTAPSSSLVSAKSQHKTFDSSDDENAVETGTVEPEEKKTQVNQNIEYEVASSDDSDEDSD